MAENIQLPASAGSKKVDTFIRTEGADEVHMQAMVPVDPVTGEPNAATQATLAQLTEINETLLVLLGSILEKLPRINANDRVFVELSESSTLPAIATINDLLRMQGFGTVTVNVTKVADGIPTHAANAGAMHIYNNILVS